MKAKIALITGGYTEESKISLKSADFVFSQLDHGRYDVYKIMITPQAWYHEDGQGKQVPVDRNGFTLDLDGQTIRFDLAFVMLHGSPGEDGRLQGYLDIVGIPYTSCDALTAALTMNKAYTKAVLQGITDLYMAKSVLLFGEDRPHAADMVAASLSLPFFVKPNAGGSSIGMSKVKELSSLQQALDMAFDTANASNQVIVEEFVKGREFSVGIFRRLDGSLYVLPASEMITSREFFDYEAKYTPGLTQEITPADLTAEQRDRVVRLVREIYLRLNCKGMARVDFFIEEGTGRFFFIEINTVPGQSLQSLIPLQVRTDGMKESDFYAELIEVALNPASALGFVMKN